MTPAKPIGNSVAPPRLTRDRLIHETFAAISAGHVDQLVELVDPTLRCDDPEVATRYATCMQRLRGH